MHVTNPVAVALALLCLPFSVSSQIVNKAIIEFSQGSILVDASVKHQLEEVYEALPIGRQVNLELVEIAQIKRDYDVAARLSQSRCQAIEAFYTRAGLMPHQLIIQRYNWPWPSGSFSSEDDERYKARAIYQLSVIREPDLPLQFTHSALDPFEEGCEYHMINNATEVTLVHQSGMIIILPPHAFVSKSGYPIDDSSIEVQYCSYTTKADFLLADITSSSGKRMLESAGMLYVKATAGGEALRLKRSADMIVVIPSDEKPDKRMIAFDGHDQYGITDWVPAQGARMKYEDLEEIDREEEMEEVMQEELDWEFEWDGMTSRDTTYVEDLLTGEQLWTVTEMRNRTDAYIMSVSNLGWINCDRFYDIEQPVDLMVNVPENWENVSVRLVFKSIRSVLPGYYVNENGLVKFESVPAGEEVTLVAYGKKGSRMLWDEQEMILGDKKTTALALTEVSKNDFAARLQAFAD